MSRHGPPATRWPARLIGDKVYDPEAHNKKLCQEYNIKLIAPNRRSR